MKCPNCDADVPDGGRFCPYCGNVTSVQPVPGGGLPANPETPTYATLLAMLAGMLLFFAIALTIVGAITGFWWGAIGLVGGAALLFLTRYLMLRTYWKKLDRIRASENARLICSYCGGVNSKSATRCLDCGAPLIRGDLS